MMMLDLASGKLARLACVVCLAVAATVLLAVTAADSAAAATRKLSGTHTSAEIGSTCATAGGVYYPTQGGGYGCATEKGKVECTKAGKCTGTCSNCANVVRGVNGVLRPPASAGTASAAGGATSNKIPVNNTNQPVAVQHAGGHSSNAKH